MSIEGANYREEVLAASDRFGGVPGGDVEGEIRLRWGLAVAGAATGRAEMADRYYRSGLTPAELLEDAATASALLAIAAGPRDEGSRP